MPLLALALLTLGTAFAATLTPADNKVKQDIISNMSNTVDHRYSQYDLILGSKVGDNSTFTIYNKTGSGSVPPIVCGEGTHMNNGTCIPNPVPPDNTTNKSIKIDFTGDISGTSVINAIKARNADFNIANGDLGYKSDLSWFKSVWNTVKNHGCTVGNHDSPEDGNSAIFVEAKQYCGDIWFKTFNSTLIIGFNTNGNLDTQLGTAQSYVMNSTQMEGIKNVILSSHKPCQTPPNSHHTIEGNVKTFCNSLIAKIPSGVNVYGIAAHNHVLAKGENFFISGAGGKSHYECGTDSKWTFCNNTKYGFLELVIKDDKITTTFYDTNGGSIK